MPHHARFADTLKERDLADYEASFSPLTRGRSAQVWDVNSSKSCASKFHFISSSDFPAGEPGRLKNQAHSEQPHPPKLGPSIHTNLRDELSWPL
jgi:hypothetical protein